jgi:MoCo/4Fe-4S cofactor protein with predicted Tat translocation signal
VSFLIPGEPRAGERASAAGAAQPETAPDPGRGREFWRTLDELADDPAFRETLANEFPSQVEAITDPVQRRTFLKVMGASLGLAGLTACTRQPLERIVPYVQQPEHVVPGRPLFYATAMTLGGTATGVIVESHEGRPTKIEGNPDHPDSLGATSVFGQAAILDLYDPDRARAITHLGEIRPWSELVTALGTVLGVQDQLQGAGLRILTESICSPTLAAQMQRLLARFPAARWHEWDPASRDNARAGARLAFGEHVDTQYRVDEADVILSLDADFLAAGAGSLRHARQFSSRRRPENPDRVNRLYVLETMLTSTGAKADHRLALRPSEIVAAARLLAAAVGVEGVGAGTPLSGPRAETVARWVQAVARDLVAHRGASLVIPGDTQPPIVHALAHAMNEVLANVGATLTYTDPVEASPIDHVESLRELVADMNGGRVTIVVILSANPVHTAPGDLNFGEALDRVPLRIHLGSHVDETAERCHWQIPEAHFLESWSDARASDGTASIVQPLILPLYGGRSAHEVLAALTGDSGAAPYDVVREHWLRRHAQGLIASAAAPNLESDAPEPTAEFESAWRRWLHDGFVPGTAFAPRTVALRPGATAGIGDGGTSEGLELSFRNDPTVLDGRFANNGWLQELPKPITKLTWDNAVLVSPATAARLGVGGHPSMQGGEHGQIVTDVVELRAEGRLVRGAVFTVPGHADDCVTVHLGYGRRRGGRVAAGAGFDANAVRSSASPWSAGGVEVIRTGSRFSLACTQYHHLMEGRGMVRAVTLDDFARDPHVVHEGHHVPPRTLTLNPEYPYDGYKWGMAIDVNVCTGCNACVVGCQAENNVPVIGKDQVLRGREMHWLRVDRYHRGPVGNPETYFQPVPCMHCENAPCEVVCPVNATVHTHEGLNDMVYNRCVGTRYCANNCPYKVRRFNYHLYQDWDTPSLKLLRNPDVTVRSRGIMEKCTYCVQRISAAKIEAGREDRRVRDGEVRTACQAACPSDAIVFGDLNDPGSRVARLQAEQRNYSLLAELNTRPRTTYLAAVRNVNPEIEG